MSPSVRLLCLLAAIMAGGGCRSIAPAGTADHEPDTVSLSPLDVRVEPIPKLPPSVEFPMKLIGGFVVVEADDEGGVWNFLIDTGSSATLVSPAFAIRHRSRVANPQPGTVWLRDATGRAVPVESVLLDKVDFGPAHFRSVRALVFDCSDLSDHLGLQIDGVLGFKLFANARLTLDYPGERIVMSALPDKPPLRGSVLPFSTLNEVPSIEVFLGGRSLTALIDTGSDGGLNLDPAGLDLDFASPPREGTLIGTLHGDHRQIMARSARSLHFSDYRLERPVVDLSGRLTAIGSDILRNFELTFDQEDQQVAFYRAEADFNLPSPALRSSGMSFTKVRAYWRITAVAPDSPAQAAGFLVGDLVIKLNGEPVDQWDLTRYRELVDAGGSIDYTFIKGREEVTIAAAIFDLVP